MFFDWWGKHFSINAFLVHSCKRSLVYYSFIVQEKRKRVLQTCFLARNLNIHHQSVNDKEGLPHTVFGSVREFTNQPNVHGLTSPKTMGFPLCKKYCAFLLHWRLTRKKTGMWRGLAAVHTHAENMMWPYIPVEQMKSSSCTSPPSIYEEPLTLHQYGCACYWKMAKSIAFFIGLKLITVDKQLC